MFLWSPLSSPLTFLRFEFHELHTHLYNIFLSHLVLAPVFHFLNTMAKENLNLNKGGLVCMQNVIGVMM